jgi:hypothetical protein
MPDGKSLRYINPLARCYKDGPIYGYTSVEHSIYGDGLRSGHGGSGLSALGGTIRKGELVGDRPIRHALKVLLWAKKYYYYSYSIKGYRWPADRADSYASPDKYAGKNPSLVLGSLLAIPPYVTEASLNLRTPAAKKLFHALQDYGAYTVDDSAWDCHYIAVEKGVTEEFQKTYGYGFSGSKGLFYEEFMRLFQALQVVSNNGPNNIGGGGILRAPLAPPIGN